MTIAAAAIDISMGIGMSMFQTLAIGTFASHFRLAACWACSGSAALA